MPIGYISLALDLHRPKSQTIRTAQKIALQSMIIGVGGTHARHDDHIISVRKLLFMQTIDLAQSAANSISDNSVAYFIGYGKADSIIGVSVISAIEYKARGCGAVSFGIETPKFVILF